MKIKSIVSINKYLIRKADPSIREHILPSYLCFFSKVCVHCKCDRSDHEIGPNQALNIYERLGIKPSVEMAKVMQQQKQQAQRNNSNDLATIGSVGHGYAWVPPGISRIKVNTLK
jgi:hypothetical protein